MINATVEEWQEKWIEKDKELGKSERKVEELTEIIKILFGLLDEAEFMFGTTLTDINEVKLDIEYFRKNTLNNPYDTAWKRFLAIK